MNKVRRNLQTRAKEIYKTMTIEEIRNELRGNVYNDEILAKGYATKKDLSKVLAEKEFYNN